MPIQTCRQFVSDVVGSLRSLGIDDRIPSRLVLSKGRDTLKTLFKQDVDSRRVLKTTDIWMTIPCFHLCKVDAQECGDIPHCDFLMKSELQLPEVFETSYGDMVKVFTLDGNKEYNQTQIFAYKDIKNREYKDAGQRYFWILDRHIYIPDSEVKEVMIIGLFMFPYEVTKLIQGDDCLFPLDSFFPAPDYLLSIVKQEVIKELATIYKRLPVDSDPDGNPNKKS